MIGIFIFPGIGLNAINPGCEPGAIHIISRRDIADLTLPSYHTVVPEGTPLYSVTVNFIITVVMSVPGLAPSEPRSVFISTSSVPT